MDYRQGKCSSCGAEYKIPASFQHDAAKCKECGGVVNIGPVQSGSTPPAPAKTGAPIPARQFAGKRPEEAKPAPKPAEPAKKGGGTLEKLKAQRAAAAAAGEAKSATPAQRKPAAATPAAKPAAAPGRARAGAKAGAKVGAGAAVGAKAGGKVAAGSTRRSSGGRRGRGGDDGDDEGGGRGRRGARQQKKPNMALFGIAIVLLIAGGGAAFFMFKNEGTQAQEPTDDTANAADGATDAGGEDAGADEGTESTDDTAGDTETAGDAEGSDEASGDEPAAEEKPAEKPADEQPKPKKGDPSSVDLLSYADFTAPSGVSASEWSELQELVSTFLADDGARSSRALRSLQEAGPAAVPAMLNEMKKMDLGDEYQATMCNSLQRALTEIAHGSNWGWYSGTEDTPHYQNKRVVEQWIKIWMQADQDIQAWINFSKMEERAPDKVDEVRAKFTKEGAAVIDDAGDDLDVD